MNSIPGSVITTIPTRKCPHLGILEDKKTWSATDQIQNHCHAGKHPQPVDWEHQCQFCFNDSFRACPILLAPLPPRHAFALSNPRVAKILAAVVLGLFVLTAGGTYLWRVGFPPLFELAIASQEETQAVPAVVISTQTPRSVVLPGALSTATPVQTSTLSPSPTHTPAQLPSVTPTVQFSATPGPGLMTPFGAQKIYLIHRVQPGESLEMLAALYTTSEAVLRVLNGLNPGDVLWVDRLIVVLPGVKDAQDVQLRKALYLEADTTIQALEKTHGVTAGQLRQENDLGGGDVVPGGRWLVVP